MPDDVSSVMGNIRGYGESIDDELEEQDAIVDVLDVVLGTEYARNMTAVRHHQNSHASSLTLLYRGDTATIGPALLPIVVRAGLGVIVAPLAAFVSSILRAATIARRTVSVGPVIPPAER